MTPIIIDLILLLILVLFISTGFRRGLVSSLAGLLSFIIALLGASLLARACAPTVATWIAPSIETALVEKFQTAQDDQNPLPSATPTPETSESANLPSSGSESEGAAAEDTGLFAMLKQFGLYERVAQYIADATEQQTTAASTGIAKALSLSLALPIAFWALFLAFSIVLRIVLGILIRALNLVARLPVLHQLNHVGGLLFGLIQGIVFLFLIAWILHLFAFRLPENTVEQTVLLRLLLHSNPFALLPALPLEIQT
jgi:uncharacterized membrane protein required for colicin V production